MSHIGKSIEKLNPSDLEKYPIWQYINNDQFGETAVRPVKKFPVANFSNRVVGDYVALSNGRKVLGLFGNLDVRNGKLTEHFLTFSIFHDDTWCGLSRYHDFDYLEHGPSAMAHFLKLDIDEVFPIYFDIRRFSLGNEEVLSGQIMKNPVNKLSRGEIVALAVP